MQYVRTSYIRTFIIYVYFVEINDDNKKDDIIYIYSFVEFLVFSLGVSGFLCLA